MGTFFYARIKDIGDDQRLNGISAVLAFLAVSTVAEAQNGKLFRIRIGGTYYPVG